MVTIAYRCLVLHSHLPAALVHPHVHRQGIRGGKGPEAQLAFSLGEQRPPIVVTGSGIQQPRRLLAPLPEAVPLAGDARGAARLFLAPAPVDRHVASE